MFDFSLISKIDEYYSDIQKAGVLIPRSRLHIKQSAVMSYVIWGTSFSLVINSGGDLTKKKKHI